MAAKSCANSFAYLDAATESVLIGGVGSRATLHTIIVGTLLATAVVVVHDGTTASDPVIATINAAAEREIHFDLSRPNGIFVILNTANAKVTVLYS